MAEEYFPEIVRWYLPLRIRCMEDIDLSSDAKFEVRIDLQFTLESEFFFEQRKDGSERHVFDIVPSKLNNIEAGIELFCSNHDLYSDDTKWYFMNTYLVALQELKNNNFDKWYSFINECTVNYYNGDLFHKYFLDNYGVQVFNGRVTEVDVGKFNELKMWMEENVPNFAIE